MTGVPSRYVKRHLIDAERFPDMLASTRADLERRRLSPPPTLIGPLRRIAQLGEEAIALLSFVDRRSPFLHDAARALAQGNAASLVLASGVPGTPIEVPFYDRRVVFPATGPDSPAHVGSWRDGYYGALLARDAECLELLAGIRDSGLRGSKTRSDEYAYAWKAALIAFRSDPSSAVPILERAMVLVRPGNFEHANPGAARTMELTFPLLGHVARGDEAAFNDGLAAALVSHHGFWGMPTRRGNFYGFVAWGPLAVACLAFDRGMRVDVESDYLLPYLIERRFESDERGGTRLPGA